MERYYILGSFLAVPFCIVIYILVLWIDELKFAKRIRSAYFSECDPEKAVALLDRRIHHIRDSRVQTLKIRCLLGLVLIGRWSDVKKIKGEIYLEGFHPSWLLLFNYSIVLFGFITENTELIEEKYNEMMQDEKYEKYWSVFLPKELMTSLYTFHMDHDMEKYIEMAEKLHERFGTYTLYRGLLYYYEGRAYVEMGNSEEALKAYTNATAYGENTIFKVKAMSEIDGLQ